MQTASLPPDSFQDVLARLPPDLDLNALARSTKAIQRARKVTDGKDLLRLALARGPGGLSLNQTAAWAQMSGLAELSDPGLKKRLDNAVPLLKAVMEQQLAERAGGATLRWPGRCLRVVPLPAGGGRHQHQPTRQQGHRLAGTCRLRPGDWRFRSPGPDG
jgi:hypothetical protein